MFFTGDVFMHTWDLARATGQPEQLDEGMAAEMLAGMEPIDEMLRQSGQYGPKVEPPPGADADHAADGLHRPPGLSGTAPQTDVAAWGRERSARRPPRLGVLAAARPGAGG